MFECRWKDCRLEYTEYEKFIAHITTHVDMTEPIRVGDIKLLRKSQGFSAADGG